MSRALNWVIQIILVALISLLLLKPLLMLGVTLNERGYLGEPPKHISKCLEYSPQYLPFYSEVCTKSVMINNPAYKEWLNKD